MADSEETEIGAGIGEGFGDANGMSAEAIDALLAAADAEAAAQTAILDAEVEAETGVESAAATFGETGAAFAAFGDSAASFGGTAPAGNESGFSRVRDIPLEVTVELGRTRLLIKDILDLSAGSIIELDKIAGEPVDLFANGLLVARGEVIVIDDNFGVRVTEIITAADRIREAGEAHALAA